METIVIDIGNADDAQNSAPSHFVTAFEKRTQTMQKKVEKDIEKTRKMLQKMVQYIQEMKRKLEQITNRKWDIELGFLPSVFKELQDIIQTVELLTAEQKKVTISAAVSNIEFDTAQIEEEVYSIGGYIAGLLAGRMSNIEIGLEVLGEEVVQAINAGDIPAAIIENIPEIPGSTTKSSTYENNNVFNTKPERSGSYIDSLVGGVTSSDIVLGAIGTEGAAGTLTGMLSLFKGRDDFITALTTTDSREADAYMKAAIYETVLPIDGAIIAAIGAAVLAASPVGVVLAALAGFGAGGVVGSLLGEEEKTMYANELSAEALAAEQAKYQSPELKTALAKVADEKMSWEDFNILYEKVVADGLNQRFGNINLSSDELSSMAQKLVFKDGTEELEMFLRASEEASNSLSALYSTMGEIKYQNWKVEMGFEFSESDVEAYKQAYEVYTQQTKQYVEDARYEFHAAVKVLFEGETADEIIAKVNPVYSEIQVELGKLEIELHDLVEDALKDGVITEEERTEITDKQQEIDRVTEQVAYAEQEAELSAAKIMYGGDGLDADSFIQYQEEINKWAGTSYEINKEALKTMLAGYHLQYILEEDYTEEHLKADIESANDQFNASNQEVNQRLEAEQFSYIAKAFEEELAKAFGDLDIPFDEELGNRMMEAIQNGVNIAELENDGILKLFGLEGIEYDDVGNEIIPLIKKVYDSLQTEIAKIAEDENGNFIATYFKQTAEVLRETEEIVDPIEIYFSDKNIETVRRQFYDMLANGLTSEQIESDIPVEVQLYFMSEMSEEFSLGQLQEDLADLELVVLPRLMVELSNEEKKELAERVLEGETLLEVITDIQVDGNLEADTVAMIQEMSVIEAEIEKICGKQQNVGKVINIETVVKSTGFSVMGSVTNIMDNLGISKDTFPKRANGGFVSGRQLSWVGEEGPEAIIPLVPGRRSRGIQLWQQAGEMLGVMKHAAGGIIGNITGPGRLFEGSDNMNMIETVANIYPVSITESEDNWIYDASPVVNTNNGTGEGSDVILNVSVSPKFEISGQDSNEDNILDIIKSHMKEMADELGGQMAVSLEEVFSNMPVREV